MTTMPTHYRYSFRTIIHFGQAVQKHQFLLRCIPRECTFQRLVTQHCEVEGASLLHHETDVFGNTITYGLIAEPHHTFSFLSEGEVEVLPYCSSDALNRLFCYPSPLTNPSPALAEFVEAHDDALLPPVARAQHLAQKLHETFIYQSGVTNCFTTAEAAFYGGRGVCQDYAHIFVTLCRLAGIPARYANGFLRGEGESHAWAEVHDGTLWHGIDPTHNRLIESGYIKVAHGRDADDCPINRGTFIGCTNENSTISIHVEMAQ